MLRTWLAVLALCAGSLHADVTARYKMELKNSMPAIMQQAAGQFLSAAPTETIVRVKGSKGYFENGGMCSIDDSAAKRVTLLDKAGKKFAIASSDDFMRLLSSVIPAMPAEAAGLMASFKSKAESRATGRAATIQGIEAEEREVVISVEGPAMPNLPAGPMLRMVMQIWISKESEMARVPAIREFSAYTQSAVSTMNPAGGIKKILELLPGMGEGLASLMKEISPASGVALRIHFDLFMPAIAAAMGQSPAAAAAFGADFDPNAPLMQMNQEMVELSTAAVPDSLFQVPADYQEQPIDEYMKTYMAQFAPKAK